MPGLVPGIHVFLYAASKDVDGRDRPGHDDEKNLTKNKNAPGVPGALVL
jgi:citronellyl-CoA dehydrogenase